MSLLDELRNLLTRDERHPLPALPEGMEAFGRATVFRTLERFEREGSRTPRAAKALRRLHQRWTGPGYLSSFVRYTCAELSSGLAVEWLLHLEVERSTGAGDPWRVCRAVARSLLDARVLANEDWEHAEREEGVVVPTDGALRRMRRLGVVRLIEEGNHGLAGWGWALLPLGELLLPRVLQEPPTAMHHLARAAGDDDSGVALSGRVDGLRSTRATFGFSRLVSHELRNAIGPLRAALVPILEAARGHVAGHDHLAARVRRGLARLEDFADQTARLGRHGGDAEACSVARCIEDAVRDTAHERDGRLRAERELVEAEVWGQPQRLVVAFANVVRNAAQAARETGGVLRTSVALDGEDVVVVFSDDGPGVPPGILPRVFEPGFSTRGGSGLGLTLVRELVCEEMNGHLDVEPTPGGGATLRIRFPTLGAAE